MQRNTKVASTICVCLFVCIQIIHFMIHLHAISIVLFNPFYTILHPFFLILQLHIHDIISQCCIFLRWIPPWIWPKKAETSRRLAIWLYTFVSNCCAVVSINSVKITALFVCVGGTASIKYYLHGLGSEMIIIIHTGSGVHPASRPVGPGRKAAEGRNWPFTSYFKKD